MLRYFIGEPTTVYTAWGKGIVNPNILPLRGYDVEDYTATTATFKSGAVANIFTGCYLEEGGGMKLGLTFYAKDATIDYELRSKVTFTDINGTKEILAKKFEGNEPEPAGLALDRTFIDAVKSGKPADIQKIRSPYKDAEIRARDKHVDRNRQRSASATVTVTVKTKSQTGNLLK
jgi:predicted dehydrogenase